MSDNMEETKTEDQVITEADEKATGVVSASVNEDAIVEAKDRENSSKSSVKPSFFIKRSSRTSVVLDVLSSKADGKIVSVSKSGLGLDFDRDFPFLAHTELKFEFSIPNYEEMSNYRQRSSTFRRDAQQIMVDKQQLRNFLLVWHLKDWNMTDDDGNKIVLTFDSNGSLSEESLASVYAMSPTLVDVVLTSLEKDLLMT